MHITRTARQAKIIGGIASTPHEFPYQVNLRYHDELLCGGSILSTIFILTAAHCVKYKLASKLSVVAGDHDHIVREGNEQLRNVSHIFMHEDYNWESDENDIAILALSRPLEFNRYVGNISLPEENAEFSGMATVAGWGKVKEYLSSTSDILQKVKVPIISKAECQKSYGRVKMNVTQGMLCAGNTDQDSCRGDSGSPLACQLAGKTVQCGIVSHGIGCGRKGFAGIYTDVSKYVDWVANTMDQLRLKTKCKMNRFYCPEDKKCIPRSNLCNQIRDCSKGFDERNCESFTRSPPTHFRCNNGISIKSSWVCDSTDDCGDNSDEEKCSKGSCSSSQFQCPGDGRCIEKSWLCDDFIDCEDASDEASCNDNELIPTSTSSLDGGQVSTDGNKDDSSCDKGFFRCPGNRIRGICIPERWLCDGEKDCKTGEDEDNCSSKTPINSSPSTTVATITLDIDISTTTSTQTSTISSLSTSSRPTDTLHECTSTQFYCPSLKLCIPRSFLCDGDEDCPPGEDEANCTLNKPPTRRPLSSVISIGSGSQINATKITVFPAFKPKCPSSDYFMCKSGDCVLKEFVCDLDRDCDDGSDESQCSTKPPCSWHQWKCANGDCIYHRFRCDRDIDCVDQSDEDETCQYKKNMNCTSSEFSCRSGDCVPISFQCDGDEDCLPEGEDEQGCPEPLF